VHWIGSISRRDRGGIETGLEARGCGEICRKISGKIKACLNNLGAQTQAHKKLSRHMSGEFYFHFL
jgi:hypothetical protein